MNYLEIYIKLIHRAQVRTNNHDTYLEQHHILPKCLGGTNSSNNLVKLTPEEHYVAHQLLVKLYPDNESLIYAARMMTVCGNGQFRNNKEYAWLKQRYQKICKTRTGTNNPSFGKYWFYNPATGENGKFKEGDKPSGWMRGRNKPKTRIRRCKICNLYLDEVLATNNNKRLYCKDHKPIRKRCSKNRWHTPAGVFDNTLDAAYANNCSAKTLYNRAKSNKFKDYSMGD